MSILYVVRHGESEANADTSIHSSGKSNWKFTLTKKGSIQADMAGLWIKNDILSNLSPAERTSDVRDEERPIPISIITSPYLRAHSTAQIIQKHFGVQCKKNMLLSEWNVGEDDGTKDVFDFDNRPLEKHFKEKLGRFHYKPHRAESFLDMHVRAGVFVCQQNFFEFQSHAIAVTHMSFGLALHHFLLETISTDYNEEWHNGEVRKYERQSDRFEYRGTFYP